MNNEENKSKELRDSIDRMADELAKVIKTAQSAYDKIAHVELREGSGAAWRMLCVAVCELRHTLRPKPGTAAFLTEITDYYCEHEPRLRLMPENEKPDAAPEAGQKTPDPIAESIKRMQGVLDEVESNVRAVRFLVSGMESEQLKWAHLSRACGRIHDLTRLGWQKLTEKPEVFRTPKEIIDFVTANPPLGVVKDAPTPLDPTAPEMLQGLGQVWKAIGTDTCGIRRANGTVRAWVIMENAGVEVFAKQIFKDGKPEPCWTFSGTVDCEKVIFGGIIGGRNKANQIVRFIRNGLIASCLRSKHKRMNRVARVVDSGRPDLTVIDDPGTGIVEPSHE